MAKSTTNRKSRGRAGSAKTVETLTHDEASRKNIPTAEFESVMAKDDQSPIRVAYERRNRDLEPSDRGWRHAVAFRPVGAGAAWQPRSMKEPLHS